MKWILYCTTNKINGKIYIGVHKTENPDVFDGYIGNGIEIGWTIKNPQTAFQFALKKYGYSNFYRSTLKIFDNEDDAYNEEARIVDIEFLKRHDNYNTSLGGKHSGVVYDKLYQYDLEGNFIKEWFSVGDAVKYYQCNSNRFNMAITDQRSAFNSYWTKKYVEKLDVTDYRKSGHSEIYQYDLNGNFLEMFENVKDIREKFNLSQASVDDAMSRKVPIKGFYFISNGNIMDIIKKREEFAVKNDKCVSSYNKDTKQIIRTYPSITQAAKETQIKFSDIKKAISTGNPTENLLWSFGFNETYIKQEKPVGRKVAQYDLEGNLVKVWESLATCAKEHPKCRDVLKGNRNQTHGFKFKFID